jgi:hypothetical protein
MPQNQDPTSPKDHHGTAEADSFVQLAKQTLRDICENEIASASARVTAARTLLELSGELKNTPRDQGLTSSAELSSAEIDRRLAKLGKLSTHGSASVE